MKKNLALLLCLLALTATATSYRVIPLPRNIEDGQGKPFTLTAKTRIAYPEGNADMERNAHFLADFIQQATGLRLAVTTGKGQIVLSDNWDGPKEGYRLSVTAKAISISGASAAGCFYGIETLRKALPCAKAARVALTPVEISDWPRFGYRGAHLDVSRHFFPTDSVKKFIDMIALHHINRFHWHLTDDQGWRIEIKSRPELVKKGSMRPGTMIGKDFSSCDNVPYGGYYTQQQIREVIAYAAERYITIIPEIDLPGHMLGALAAYPELGCTGGPYTPWTIWGVADDVLCAGNEATYKLIDNVLGEVAALFPSKLIHIGGDECPKTRWKTCPKCQAKCEALGLKDDEHGPKEEKLQSHVIHHASDFLAQKGKTIIGWDEILEGGLAPGAVVMSWRGEAGGKEASRQGHDVIMTPNTYLYFDYYQSRDTDHEPLAIGGYLPVETVYNYEPMPADMSAAQAAHILGVQANLWTEYIHTYSHVEYMELPRMAALSEVQWCEQGKKDYPDFLHRLPNLIKLYQSCGYNYAKHVVK